MLKLLREVINRNTDHCNKGTNNYKEEPIKIKQINS